MTFKRATIFQWLAVSLSLVPVILYAYLGQFSRLMFDDYCIIASAREMGVWGYMVDARNVWSGSYANWFLKGAMAPLDILVARITPLLIVGLWLVGLAWLIFQGLAYLKIVQPRRMLSVAIAALAVAASIHAFYSPQSFYWYSSSTQNTLPLALLTIYMALALWTVQQRRRDTVSLLGIIAGGLLCFISAGSSEVFVGFQTTLLALCLLAIFTFLPSLRRRIYLPVFGVGWLATLVGLAIQLSAPGVALRAAHIAQQQGLPNRSISVLMPETLARSFAHIKHPQALAGFAMLMAVGLLIMLVKYKPQSSSETSKPVKLALSPLWLGLVFQLLWLPLLWLQTSDSPQWLGRFSGRYMAVVMLNILFILGFLLMLWRRKRLQAQLQKRERGRLTAGYIMASACIFVLLLAVTQLDIDHLAAGWLFTSLLMLLVLLTWQLLSMLPSAAARRLGMLALCSSGIGWVCMAAMIFISMYGAGYVQPRTMAAGAYLLVLPGLVWGVWLGYLVKQFRLGPIKVKLLKSGSLVTVLIVGVGIVLGQVALMPNFQLYAREWDARHREIIKLRDSGRRHIETAPLTWNLVDYVAITTMTDLTGCAPRYYDVVSITVTDS